MNPQRVCVGDLIKPLGVGRTGVDLDRQSEGRDKRHLLRGESGGMNMTPNVSGKRVLPPAPARQRRREELKPPRGGREPAQHFPIDAHPHLSLIHISEPTRRTPISYAVFCLKKKKKQAYQCPASHHINTK